MPPRPPPDLDAIAERIRSAVAEHRSAKLSAFKIPTALKPELIERLRDLEVKGSLVRRPVAAQILDELAAGAFLPLASIAPRLAGVTAAEGKKTALQLAAEGKAVLVLRAGKEVLVPLGTDILRGQEVVALARAAKALQALASKAARSDRALLKADITPLVTPTDPTTAVIQACKRVMDPRLGLAFVPAVVRELKQDTASAHGAILKASRAGAIELRPESGLGRLSADDTPLCLPGPEGMTLSWIRVLP